MTLSAIHKRDTPYCFGTIPAKDQAKYIGRFEGIFPDENILYPPRYKWAGEDTDWEFSNHATKAIRQIKQIFLSRLELCGYCVGYPAARFTGDNLKTYYGFSIISGEYAFYVRCFTGVRERNLVIYCYHSPEQRKESA